MEDKNAKTSENWKYSILLPKNNYITEGCLFQYYHEKHVHGGVQLLLSETRQICWVKIHNLK